MLIVIIRCVIKWRSPSPTVNDRGQRQTGGLLRLLVGYRGVQNPHAASLWTRVRRAARHGELLPEGSSLLLLAANDCLDVFPTKEALNETSRDDHRCAQAATIVFKVSGQTQGKLDETFVNSKLIFFLSPFFHRCVEFEKNQPPLKLHYGGSGQCANDAKLRLLILSLLSFSVKTSLGNTTISCCDVVQIRI